MCLFFRIIPKTYTFLIALIFLLLGGYIALFFFFTDEYSITFLSDIFSLLFNVLATIGLALAAYQSLKFSKRLALGWGMLAFAQLLFSLGDLTWAIFELVLNISPFPSLADAAYLLYYVFFFGGVFLFPSEQYNHTEWIKRILDICIVMVTAGLIYWVFLIGPIMQQNATGFLENALSIAYPVGDLMLLSALLIIIYFHPVKLIMGAIQILALAIILSIITDSAFSFQSLQGTYEAGGILDLGWIISYIVFAFAGIFQAITLHNRANNYETKPQLVIANSDQGNNSLFFVPYIGVVGAYSLLLIKHQDPYLSINFVQLFVVVGCIILLVITRQIVGISENKNLLVNLKYALNQLKNQTDELDSSNLYLRQEISVRRQIESKLEHDAFHDGLTGLANRNMVLDRLQRTLETLEDRTNDNYCFLFLDLDNFKTINDGLGHSIGDLVLKKVGEILQGCVRTEDMVARLGGDEFIILLENTVNEKATHAITKRILFELNRPINISDTEVQVSCSIGVIRGFSGYSSPEEILRDADIAMYQAKKNGKSRYEVFSPAMRETAHSQLVIENELRRALEKKEFVLYFQPIFQLHNHQIIGVEALVRWNHPNKGLLLPSQFIEIADLSGLILPLGNWVLDEACRQFRKWYVKYPDVHDLSINVNISGKQIHQIDFVEIVKETLLRTKLDPACLKLEISENTYVENLEIFNDLVNDLRSVGVSFIIDDFGTGYSSLSYLINIPVSTIKIDKVFINDNEEKERNYSFLKAIIQMVQVLGLDIVVEGIETEDQLAFIKTVNCTFGQGFYLSKPMCADDFEKLLEHPSFFRKY